MNKLTINLRSIKRILEKCRLQKNHIKFSGRNHHYEDALTSTIFIKIFINIQVWNSHLTKNQEAEMKKNNMQKRKKNKNKALKGGNIHPYYIKYSCAYLHFKGEYDQFQNISSSLIKSDSVIQAKLNFL
jgi:hypothetical protein